MRVGLGVDAHRFARGGLVLGGVEMDFPMGLEGHSDADVLLHAVMDAILGACGAGDIGEHFPDDDPEFLGASSLDLLREVRAMALRLGYEAVNVDITVICEKPRIAPHRLEISEKIAGCLGLDTACVSVKGTSTEGMGFTGRGEGIAAVAVVLMEEVSDS